MSLWIDKKYVLLLAPKFENFKQKNTNLFNVRCPYCGDSQKHKLKARGYIYTKSDKMFYVCHNCEVGTTLRNLIGFLDPFLEKEYVMENFKESNSDKIIRTPKTPTFKKFKIKEKVIPQIDLPTIASLPDDHIAKQYILNRKLPQYSLDILYYTEDFKSFTESVSDKQLDRTSPRIVIPFFSTEGKLIAFQGRALDSDSMRYITVKIDRDVEKLFGMERINPKLPILVCEGPLDSLFLQNAIATADSNLASASNFYDNEKLILIPDNEPRNKEICKKIDEAIEKHYNVVIWPEMIESKDINDMVLEGFSPDEIQDIISKNTFVNLRAKAEFINWKKI